MGLKFINIAILNVITMHFSTPRDYKDPIIFNFNKNTI